MLTVGSLFAGIGGFDLGLERAGMQVRWQVENDSYCNNVLAKHWPDVPRYGDIKTVDWSQVETVDLVCGGFPCQPFSVAGKRRGTADDRYLWPEVVRCLDVLRPTWFLGENVPGLIKLALDQVCADLESLGYAVWPVCIPACAVDAPHRRERLWIIAYTASHSRDKRPQLESDRRQNEAEQIGLGSRESDVADTISERNAYHGQRQTDSTSRALQTNGEKRQRFRVDTRQRPDNGWSEWEVEPPVGRVADGISHRVERLRGLGNAVVPQVVEVFGRLIQQVHHET